VCAVAMVRELLRLPGTVAANTQVVPVSRTSRSPDTHGLTVPRISCHILDAEHQGGQSLRLDYTSRTREQYRSRLWLKRSLRSAKPAGDRMYAAGTALRMRHSRRSPSQETQVIADQYEVKSFATDSARNNVAAYRLFYGTHTGQGGPVPPTGRRISSDYVYVMQSRATKSST